MSLNELMAVVSPPQNPIEIGNESQMATIEEKLGTRLPDDYRAFAGKFGTGRFNDLDRVCIEVLNPFAPNYFVTLDYMCKTLRESLEIDARRTPVLYNAFPTKPGLLPWGQDDNGCTMLVEGPPNDWPIIVNPPRYSEYQQFPLSMTAFLTKAFTRQLTCILWDDPEFFSGPTPVVFQPTTQLHRIVLERS